MAMVLLKTRDHDYLVFILKDVTDIQNIKQQSLRKYQVYVKKYLDYLLFNEESE
jgi:hypothetical protein